MQICTWYLCALRTLKKCEQQKREKIMNEDVAGAANIQKCTALVDDYLWNGGGRESAEDSGRYL